MPAQPSLTSTTKIQFIASTVSSIVKTGIFEEMGHDPSNFAAMCAAQASQPVLRLEAQLLVELARLNGDATAMTEIIDAEMEAALGASGVPADVADNIWAENWERVHAMVFGFFTDP
ncbi:hypothetical protein GGTG_12634 [Gaeumannomyces tritici R3-111a-1]|uniref:Uncharacterized protein n=1 Tax=Gaeumannomyces tritici (strain R3-111a-1) TaxID=644352 RepID=J3PGK5_GAET3|nr:hypothetical protein GGTG_12634 [Gaeumannomyces tritici R3-111a-1]EJT69751.1 hypothetical protein GGTG_12634 [Gaeumannomyces tritici R3-111a-1]